MKEDDAVGIMEGSRRPRGYIYAGLRIRGMLKRVSSSGPYTETKQGWLVRESRGKAEHQKRSYQSEVRVRKFCERNFAKKRTQSVSDGCLTQYNHCVIYGSKAFIHSAAIAVVEDFTSLADIRARRKDTPRFRVAAQVMVSFDYFFLQPFVGLEPSRIRPSVSSKWTAERWESQCVTWSRYGGNV